MLGKGLGALYFASTSSSLQSAHKSVNSPTRWARSAVQAAMSSVRTIKVQGQAVVNADCNEATVDAAVRNTHDSVIEASQIVSASCKDLHTKLLTINGLDARSISTTNISIHTEYQYGPNGRQGPPKYSVQQGINVTLKEATGDSVATVINAMVQAAGDNLQLNSVSFAVSNSIQQELLATARKLAAEDATAKATLYAEALGAQLGQVVHISESPEVGPSPMPQPGMPRMKMAAAAEGFAAPVSMGDQNVTASVWVTFALE